MRPGPRSSIARRPMQYVPSWPAIRIPPNGLTIRRVKYSLVCVIQPALNVAGDMRIEAVVIVVRHNPLKQDAPGLLRCVREAQALERDRHESYVAFGSHFACGVPDRIPGRIIAIVIGPYVIEWHPHRLDHAAVIASFVVKCV